MAVNSLFIASTPGLPVLARLFFSKFSIAFCLVILNLESSVPPLVTISLPLNVFPNLKISNAADSNEVAPAFTPGRLAAIFLASFGSR